MKKSLLLLSCFLFFSCSEDQIENQLIDKELSFLLEEYEDAVLKGYTPPVKDEANGEIEEVTIGDKSIKEKIQDLIDLSYSKTAITTKANNISKVGVFKHSTCGSYPEFHYFQDHQDNGHTQSIGDIGATSVDRNKNTSWKFCLVPASTSDGGSAIDYGGGVLLLVRKLFYRSSPLQTSIVYYRLHDDEDSSNKNSIQEYGGLSKLQDYIGECLFNKNTGFTWIYLEGSSNNKVLPFKYGVLSNNFNDRSGLLRIDDENSRNVNYITKARWRSPVIVGETNFWELENGIYNGINATSDTEYAIKFY